MEKRVHPLPWPPSPGLVRLEGRADSTRVGGEVGARLKSHLELCHPCSESPQLNACQAPKGWSRGQSPCMWAGAETLGTSTISARGLLPARGSGTHIWKPSNHDRPPLEAWALCPRKGGGFSAQGPGKPPCP